VCRTSEVRCFVLAAGMLVAAGQAAIAADPAWMTVPLATGEAAIVYLYHSGWLVRTRSSVLVFDPVAAPQRTVLDPLGIEAASLAGPQVVVLVSHAHDDHWDPSILEWSGLVPGIRYVLGWELDGDPSHLELGSERAVTRVGGTVIYNVHHAFDGIPESAFLVHVDGLWIYHAGDHSHSRGAESPVFRGNLEYLAAITTRLDVMFTPTWGGELFAIECLRPRVVFPMHDGGNERQYTRWAARPEVAAPRISVGAAERPGQCFLYRAGHLRCCP